MSRPRLLTTLFALFWVVAAGYLYAEMMAFEAKAGVAALKAPSWWPKDANLTLSNDRHTLIIFLHPKCTCSRASIAQITKLQKLCPGRFHTILSIWQPESSDNAWSPAPFTDDGALLDYQIVWDRGGRLAARFDAHTSGQTFVYDQSGRLEFSGGITSSRGNSDDGPAFASLAQVIRSQRSATWLPVFGCKFEI